MENGQKTRMVDVQLSITDGASIAIEVVVEFLSYLSFMLSVRNFTVVVAMPLNCFISFNVIKIIDLNGTFLFTSTFLCTTFQTTVQEFRITSC